jgi:hypothetical protein
MTTSLRERRRLCITIILATALIVLPLTTGTITNNNALAQSESEIVIEPIPEDEPIVEPIPEDEPIVEPIPESTDEGALSFYEQLRRDYETAVGWYNQCVESWTGWNNLMAYYNSFTEPDTELVDVGAACQPPEPPTPPQPLDCNELQSCPSRPTTPTTPTPTTPTPTTPTQNPCTGTDKPVYTTKGCLTVRQFCINYGESLPGLRIPRYGVILGGTVIGGIIATPETLGAGTLAGAGGGFAAGSWLWNEFMNFMCEQYAM